MNTSPPIMLLMLLMLLICSTTSAQFADIPLDETSVSIGLSGDSEARSTSATGILPLDKINGWFGVHALQSSADNKIVSEYLKTRLQAGFRYKHIGIEGFVDGERNLVAGTAFQSQAGIFIRPGIFKSNGFRISGGFGNFLENTQAREELGLQENDPTVVRWLAFASVGWRGISTLIKSTPHISFKDFQLAAEPAVTYQLADNISLGLQGRVAYDSDPLTDQKIQTAYMLVSRLTF